MARHRANALDLDSSQHSFQRLRCRSFHVTIPHLSPFAKPHAMAQIKVKLPETVQIVR